uniref:Uncharacterized protein n=1 Tax=viral metagenome TaxID=1070528 RepID=A0A6C0H0Z9_9ZZZZ
MKKYHLKKSKNNKEFIESLLNNYDEPEADKINKFNEKSLSKELKKLIKNNSNNIVKSSGGGLKLKPIDTHILIQ